MFSWLILERSSNSLQSEFEASRLVILELFTATKSPCVVRRASDTTPFVPEPMQYMICKPLNLLRIEGFRDFCEDKSSFNEFSPRELIALLRADLWEREAWEWVEVER